MKEQTKKLLKSRTDEIMAVSIPQFSPVSDQYHSRYESLFVWPSELTCYLSFQHHTKYDAFTVECGLSTSQSWPADIFPVLDMASLFIENARIPNPLRFRASRLIPHLAKKDLWWTVSDNLLFFNGFDPNLDKMTGLTVEQRIENQLADCISNIERDVIPGINQLKLAYAAD